MSLQISGKLCLSDIFFIDLTRKTYPQPWSTTVNHCQRGYKTIHKYDVFGYLGKYQVVKFSTHYINQQLDIIESKTHPI